MKLELPPIALAPIYVPLKDTRVFTRVHKLFGDTLWIGPLILYFFKKVIIGHYNETSETHIKIQCNKKKKNN